MFNIENQRSKGDNMYYEGKVYRPPSEWRSLIVQATVGCSHNSCTFCTMYAEDSFHVVDEELLYKRLKEESGYYSDYDKIFIADGNALCLSADRLLRLFKVLDELFPKNERKTIYARPSDVLRKTPQELKAFKKAGLEMVYIGLESGSDKILKEVNKGDTVADYVEASNMLKEAGIKQSITLISGLGGRKDSKEHALESAKAISLIKPEYLSFLTLYFEQGAPMLKKVESGELELLSPEEILYELKLFFEHVETDNTVFRSNHASNYAPLAGNLPEDREKLIATIDRYLSSGNYKPEYARGF